MKNYFLLIIALVVFFIVSCSSSQLAFYKPTEEASPWKISVVKMPITNSFICKINDIEVVEESFGLFSKSFEKSAVFQERKIVMSGYKKSYEVYTGNNATSTETDYRISIFINGEKVEEFEF
ncbi:MAG: hypothetical protein IPH62_00260 [Ignavibacteriae bacterium]|nr:hypothetical protein [Ignavibacteriota bacterium]